MARAFVLDGFLPFRLNRLAAEVSERLSRIYAASFDLDIPQWRVLATLAGKREATVGMTRRIARVAPNVRTNAGSAIESGSAATSAAATTANALSGGLR